MGADFNAGAYKEIYKHPDWAKTAEDYEVKFAAKLYKTSYVQQAAKTALTKLSRMLNAYYQQRKTGDGSDREEQLLETVTPLAQVAGEISGEKVEITDILQEALLPKGDSSRGAGQIGNYQQYLNERSNEIESRGARERDRQNLDSVINGDGNLRERMTLLYNGMFVNGGRGAGEIRNSRSLKNMMAYITKEEAQAVPELSGIRMDLLSGMSQRNKRDDVFDTFTMARDLKKQSDKLKGHGNSFTRFFSGLKRAFNAGLSSKFTRRTKPADQREGLGIQHYEDLGLDLSEREKANSLDENGKLKWQEGSAWFEMKDKVNADGMIQTAGPSGTTLRMLGAYKLMGATLKDLLYFRLALIAWMVTSKDHSLYEIMKGSHNAGVTGGEDLTEPATMYMTVDPIPTDVLRQEFAPQKQFPHELLYRQMLNELRQKRQKRAWKRNAGVLKKDGMMDLYDEREFLRNDLEQITKEVSERSKAVNRQKRTLGTAQTNIRKMMQTLISQLVEKKLLHPEYGESYKAYSMEQMEENGLLEILKQKVLVSEDKKLQGMVRGLEISWGKYHTDKRKLGQMEEELQVFSDQKDYVDKEMTKRQEKLEKEGYEFHDRDTFTLYGKSAAGVMSTIGTDAQNAEAQDIALNIYTTGAFLTMTRGQKYWGGFGKRALTDERVDQYHEKGFGSYEFSSSKEMADKKVADSIFNMIRVSSRMSQDALVERGETLREDQEAAIMEGKQAYQGITYRGGKLSGAFQSGASSEFTIGSMMSSSKKVSKAGEYYKKSAEKEGTNGAVMIQYDMRGKGAVDISGVSKVQSEGEVLIPAHTRFKITKALSEAVVDKDGIYFIDEGVSQDKLQEAERELNEGEKDKNKPFICRAVRVEEVSGPGARKREQKGAVADMRREIRASYLRKMQQERQAAGN